ncbi:DUF4913 domain-containing protein [Phytomonospora sp. NPDC050363]|uniref:DUF4913 domain-containing protein n=1 Tax=Phytomonospora sp. NPDC050363 TaxID=3155642 RepID=UPI0033C3B919
MTQPPLPIAGLPTPPPAAPAPPTVPTSPPAATPEPAKATLPRRYAALEIWVADFFAPMYLHRIIDNPHASWCAEWWRHAEAIDRLTYLWDLWELNRRGGDEAVWWQWLSHHLTILTSRDNGPFRACRIGDGDRAAEHTEPRIPRLAIAPPGWWRPTKAKT